LTWQVNTDSSIVGTRVWVGEDPGNLEKNAFVPAPGSEYVVMDLLNGTTYHFALEAEDRQGRRSVRTATVSATPESAVVPPAEPEGFLATAGDAKVTLLWGFADGENPKGIHFYWGTDPEELTESRFVAAPETRLEVIGLTNGLNYGFAAEVEDESGVRSGRTLVQFAQPFEPDIEAPTIVATSPMDGATAVDPQSLLSITFSESMDLSTVTVELSPARVLRTFHWNEDGSELVSGPEVPWVEGENYEAKVTGTDSSGNPISGVDVFTFSVCYNQLAPEITGASPDPGLLNVSTNTRVSVTFSEPMEPISTNRALRIDPGVPLSYSHDARQQTFTWIPQSALDPGTQYTVTVGSTALNLRGEMLGADYIFDFNTATGPDETAPTVVSYLPENDAIGQERRFEIAIAFSEPMDHAWTQAALVFPSHPTLQGSYAWNGQGTVLRFAPDEISEHGEVIQWQLLGEAKDLAGNDLGTDLIASFQVLRLVTDTIYSTPSIDGTVAIFDEPGPWGTHWIDTDDPAMSVGSINYTNFGPSIQRAFYSFDLSSLPEDLTRIHHAEIKHVESSRYGDCLQIGNRYLESVPIGPALTVDDFDVPTIVVNICDEEGTCEDRPYVTIAPCHDYWYWSGLLWTSWVTPAVQNDWDDRLARMYLSQWRLRITEESTDSFKSRTYLASHWNVEPERRPRLIVSYEIP
jgi:hypothetical protein